MKKTIAGLLCAAMILTLGGCARAGENASPETAAPTAGAFTPTPVVWGQGYKLEEHGK